MTPQPHQPAPEFWGVERNLAVPGRTRGGAKVECAVAGTKDVARNRSTQRNRSTPDLSPKPDEPGRGPVPVAVFPGSSVLPPLLTPVETVTVLRLDTVTRPDGTEDRRSMADAMRSLEYLSRTGHLRSRRVGKSRRYALSDVLGFIAGMAPGAGAPNTTNGGIGGSNGG